MSGCTSVIALGTAYDSAASRFSKELISYADFADDQKEEIRQRVAAFHQWHRQDQLPKYRVLIDQITAALDTPQSVSQSDVEGWMDSARLLSRRLSYCSPPNGSGVFLNTLSDQQARQVAAKIRDKHEQRVREYQSETPDQRLAKRRSAIKKWANRAGVKLTTKQQEVLQNTLAAQISLSPRRHELWQLWSDRLIETLDRRGTAEFETDINQHIHALWNLTEITYPKDWQNNMRLWRDFLVEFLQLMTSQQASQLSKKLRSISKTLSKLEIKPGKAAARCFMVVR